MKQNLSYWCSRYMQLQRQFSGDWEDLALWYAPSECGTLVAQAQDRQEEAFWKEFESKEGLTSKDFFSLVRERTTAKWCHQYGF